MNHIFDFLRKNVSIQVSNVNLLSTFRISHNRILSSYMVISTNPK